MRSMTLFHKAIKLLTRELVASEYGTTLLSLVKIDRKEGVFPIILQQFRGATGVAIKSKYKSHTGNTALYERDGDKSNTSRQQKSR